MKILIVDDKEENLYLLETLLIGSGYELVTAKNGLEALGKLKEESVNLIISDILMPEMDGFQFCRECKKDDNLKQIPFIFYTATYTDKKDEEFALSLGAEKFIVKPQEPEVFLKTLNKVLKEHKKETPIISKEPIKEEGEVYFERYSKRLIQKLEEKIVELEKANKILQEKEEKICNLNQFQENIVHDANIWINVLDEKKNVVIWNEAAEKISGYSAREVIGHNKIWEWLYPDETYRKEITEKASAVIEKGEVDENFETTISCKDGRTKIISWHSHNLTNLQGKIIGSVALGRDNTAYRQAEEALAKSEEKYRTVFENTGTATTIIEEDETISMVNTQFEKLSGYSKGEIENKMKWTTFVIPEDLERMKKYHIERRKAGGKPPTEYEFQVMDKKGDLKDIFLKIAMIPNTKKSIGSLTDITERKQKEERIKNLNLVLGAISAINQLIFREKDQERLLKEACNIIIKTRGYYHSWIVLVDEEGSFETYAEAGLGDVFLALLELLKKGKFIPCIQKALKQEDILIIEDPVSSCADCPLAQKYCNQGAMTIRLESSGKVCGIMSVSMPVHSITHKEEQGLIKEVAGDIALGLQNIELGKKLNKQTYDLKERVKELSCLFKLSGLIERPGISLEEVIQELVELLPAAWQYPEITCAQIILGDKKYQTKNFKETIWKQSGDIKIDKKSVGSLEVYYLEERPEIYEGPFQKEERELLTIITERLGRFIDKTQSEIQLQQSYRKLKMAMNATVETMSKIIEVKDPYTAGHQQRVSQLATALAKKLGLSRNKIEGIRITSLVHDIGKISIPSEILSKPSKLSEVEYRLIKNHSQIGYDILKSIEFPWPIAQIVLQHHERLNGSGYPQGLKVEDILLEAKIIAVADVIEAMSSHRPYRPALGINKALEEISQNKGILYDSKVVDACLELFKEKEFTFE